MDIEKDYEELLRLFNKHKVKYCVTGAFAVAFYSIPRYTKDMDIVVEATPRNGNKIIKALKEFGFDSLKLTEKDFSRESQVIQLGYEPVRIDLLTSVDGCSFENIWKHKKTGKYGKQKVYFIGLRELVKNKKATNRKQDLVDIDILKKRAR